VDRTVKNEVLRECYKQIRKANQLNINDEDRARICDVVFENVPDLEEIEPAALGDSFPYILVRQNRMLQAQNEILKKGWLFVLWKIFRLLAVGR